MKKAQNRIDYIVYGNPKGVRSLIYQEGYEVPKNLSELSQATKLLVQKRGKNFIQKLVQIHPDKKIILQLSKGKKDCGCRACGYLSYTGSSDKNDFLDRLETMNLNELEKYYRNLNRESRAKPNDRNLEEEVRLVWEEIRQRKRSEIFESSNNHLASKEAKSGRFKLANDTLIALALTLAAGVLIGTSLHTKAYG